MTRRNTGKRTTRGKRFAPPKVPDSDKLLAHQHYGVITKFHGGADRAMNVTIYNVQTNCLEDKRCRLKGSIRHGKCKQQVAVGSYCLTEYGEEVSIIFTNSQIMSIPEDVYDRLCKVCSIHEHDHSSLVQFTRNSEDFRSEPESESDFEGVAFDDDMEPEIPYGIDCI